MRNQSFPLGAFQLAGLCLLLLISSVAAANQFGTTAYGQAATYYGNIVVNSGPNNGSYSATADAQEMQLGFAHGHADASIGSLTVVVTRMPVAAEMPVRRALPSSPTR